MFVPVLLRSLYSHDLHDVQARMFGIRGIVDLDQVDAVLLGRATGRVR